MSKNRDAFDELVAQDWFTDWMVIDNTGISEEPRRPKKEVTAQGKGQVSRAKQILDEADPAESALKAAMLAAAEPEQQEKKKKRARRRRRCPNRAGPRWRSSRLHASKRLSIPRRRSMPSSEPWRAGATMSRSGARWRARAC